MSDIRPELRDFLDEPFKAAAGCTFCGISIASLTMDELLAVTALAIAREQEAAKRHMRDTAFAFELARASGYRHNVRMLNPEIADPSAGGPT